MFRATVHIVTLFHLAANWNFVIFSPGTGDRRSYSAVNFTKILPYIIFHEICIINILSVRIIEGYVLTEKSLTLYGSSSLQTRFNTDATCNI